MASILDEFLLLFRPQVQGSGFQKLNNHIRNTTTNLFSLKNLFRTFIGYDIYSGIKQFTTSMIDATREMGAMRSRFYAITGDETKANQQLQWAFDLATKTAMPMKELADSYSIFYAATQRGLGDSGAQKVFQDWTEVSRVLHLSTYQFERVTYALREMSSKGAIYSQDLRMQIGTHVPNAMGLAEKAVNELGITGDNWFEDFRKKSKGNQKLINQFIVLFSKYAKQMYADPEALAKAMQQPDAQIFRLHNQWDKLRYAMADSGFTDDLLKALLVLNNTLDKITNHAKELYTVIKDILGIVLILFGAKYFKSFLGVLGKSGPLLVAFGTNVSKLFRRILHPIKFLKSLFRFGKFKFLNGIFGEGLGIVGKDLLKTLGLKGLLKFIGGRAFFGLIGKGILALLGPIGAVISTLWVLWDVLGLIWDLLKIKFPNQMMALKFTVLAFLNNCIAWVKNFVARILHLGTLIANWWNNLPFNKDKNGGTPGMIPNQSSINTYKDLLPLSNYGLNNGGNNNKISFNNQINIDATGLTEEQAANMIADAQEQNNRNIFNHFGNSIKDSKIM